jgi:Uma2 family endonuclease
MAAPLEAEPEYLLPKHRGPWTLEDVLALPEDQDTGQRIELVDGALLVSPLGSVSHQLLIGRIYTQLLSVVSHPKTATIELNVVLPGGRLLIPDFTVLRRSDPDGVTVAADELVLVGEVMSPSTRVQDRVLKSQLYAEAMIPYYLLVDPKGAMPSAVLLELVDGEYKEIARSRGGRLGLDRPFPVELDLIG